MSDVVGTVGGGVKDFDVDFLPASNRTRGRFSSIFAAIYSGDAIPRVDVYSLNGGYYVLDGHHRLAEALALGREFSEANVIKVCNSYQGQEQPATSQSPRPTRRPRQFPDTFITSLPPEVLLRTPPSHPSRNAMLVTQIDAPRGASLCSCKLHAEPPSRCGSGLRDG